MIGKRVVTETQSAWIADQMRRYRNVPRTPEAWQVLFAAFSRRFPRGGVGHEPITLSRYKNHAAYVERKMERQDRELCEELPRSRRSTPSRTDDGIATRSKRRVAEIEDDESLDDAAVARPRRKLRTNASIRESKQQRSSERAQWQPPRGRLGPQSKADCNVVIKQEEVRYDLECAKLRTELKECKASLKRMKHSAHAWKTKYEELLAATTAKKAPKTKPQSFAFTINVNVDVSKDGKHVQSESHAVNINHDGSKQADANAKPENARVATERVSD